MSHDRSLADEALERFESLLEGSFGAAQWGPSYVNELRRHRVLDDTPRPVALRPYMLDALLHDQLVESLGPVVRAFNLAADRLAADEPLRRQLGIPGYLEPFLEPDLAGGRPSAISRLDGIPSIDGRLLIIEYNSEPGAAPFQYEAERAFETLPITAEFRRQFDVRTVDQYECAFAALCTHARAHGFSSLPTIVVLGADPARCPQPLSFRPFQYAAARGCDVLFADPEALEYTPSASGGELRLAGAKISMVALASWSPVLSDRKRFSAVLRAIGDRAVGVVNGWSRGLLCSYKTIFELLSDPAYESMFDSATSAALRRHIPWTRVLRERTTEFRGRKIDLLQFVAEHREQFVIKPAGGTSSIGVLVGYDTKPGTWADAIRANRSQTQVVQEYVAPERQQFPVLEPDGSVGFADLNCEISPHVWNSERIEGVLCRPSRGSVIDDDRGLGGAPTATWLLRRR